MVKLKKNSNTTVRKCGFDVHSNSPHDTWAAKAAMWRRCGGAMVGGMVIYDAGKGLVISCGWSCVFWLGVFGPTDGSIKRQAYVRSWEFQKIQSQLLLKKSG